MVRPTITIVVQWFRAAGRVNTTGHALPISCQAPMTPSSGMAYVSSTEQRELPDLMLQLNIGALPVRNLRGRRHRVAVPALRAGHLQL